MMAMLDRQSAIALDFGIETDSIFRRVTHPESEGGEYITPRECMDLHPAIQQWLAQTDEVDLIDAACDQLRHRGLQEFNVPLSRRIAQWRERRKQKEAANDSESLAA